jgi:putative ABC transport system permease protein
MTLLARSAAPGLTAVRDQISHWFLANEIDPARTMASILPAVFLLVAAYLTNMVLARLVFMERAEIGLLKAFGYRNAAVVWHYAKMVVVLSLVGLLLGWAGRVLARLLDDVCTPSTSAFPISSSSRAQRVGWYLLAVSVGSSLIGVVGAARYAGALPPAEAMRPPQPPACSPCRVGRPAPAHRCSTSRPASSSGNCCASPGDRC